MGLDHFNVEILIQCGGNLAGELHQEIDAKAHIACANDGCMARCRCNFCQMGIVKAGCTNHMHTARLCRQLRMGNCGLGRGEIDHGLGFDNYVEWIIANRHTAWHAAHDLAQILADPVMPAALGHADQMRLIASGDRIDQHLAHAPRGAHDGDACAIGHVFSPVNSGFS